MKFSSIGRGADPERAAVIDIRRRIPAGSALLRIVNRSDLVFSLTQPLLFA
jgi:hypothetical protein